MELERIAVLGFGTMGASITQVFAQSGFEVVARDTSEAFLKRGLELIENGPFGINKAVAKSRMTTEQGREILSRINTTLEIKEAVKNADFVVEAVPEDIDLKRRVFAEADSLCPSCTVIVSNTSTLPITFLAAATKRPENFAGMHFFNPPQIMKLVEVIPGLCTTDKTVETVKSAAVKLGKTAVVCKDMPGFIANRIGVLAILEGMRIYEQGAASAMDIDTAMKLGYNWPMGPLELSDMIGLDVLLNVAESIHRITGISSYRPPLILQQLVAAGHFGRKTGRGFYG